MKKVFYSTIIITISLIILQVNLIYSLNNFSQEFIQNNGQLKNSNGSINDYIQFYRHFDDVAYYLTNNKICIVNNIKDGSFFSIDNAKTFSYRYDISFVGSNPNTSIQSYKQKPHKHYYFQSSTKRIEAESFENLVCSDIYEGINIKYHSVKDKFKYDFIIKAGHNYKKIRMKFDGVNSLYISSTGELIIETPFGTYAKPKPLVYQYGNNNQIIFYDTDYDIVNNELGFVINQNILTDRDLIIDPEIGLISYCGGEREDILNTVKQDYNGDYYITGYSRSDNFPVTTGALFEQYNSGNEAVILKFNSNWEPLWISYFGGNGNDVFMDINIGSDYIWLSGETTSYDFPVSFNAYQNQYAGGSADIVLTKLSKNCELLYSTYFGAGNYDSSPEAVLDSQENLWLTGRTNSNFTTTTNAEDKIGGGSVYDGIIVKFDKYGDLKYSSYLSTTANTYGEGIAIDKNDNIYVVGYTDGENLPNFDKGYYMNFSGKYDSFITKFNPSGYSEWSTYFGGSKEDFCSNITVDENNNIYIFGHTASYDIPLIGNSFQNKNNGSFDSFIAKLNSDGKPLWSTYFGGNEFEGFENSILYQLAGISVNGNKLAVAAKTISTDLYVTSNAFQSKKSSRSDAFFAVFNTNSGMLEYSTYFGGNGDERPYDILIDNKGYLINVGYTGSSDLPTMKGVFQEKNAGSLDGYIFGTVANVCNSVISYPTFDNVDKIFLNGNAIYIDDYIRMTNNYPYQSSSLWYIDKIGIEKGFETTFSFSISDAKDYAGHTDTPYPGADGLAFVIQNNSLTTTGDAGGSIGYEGIPSAIAVEYDMYYNGETNIKDPNGNHIAVFSGGKSAITANHRSTHLIDSTSEIFDFDVDGSIYYSKIKYDGTISKLYIYLAQNPFKLNDPILEIEDFDIKKILELGINPSVWVGFTSATGGSYQKHNIHSWELCSFDDNPANVNDNLDQCEFTITPNPVDDLMHIYTDRQYANLQIEIYNILGTKLIELPRAYSDSDLITINTNGLARGVYILKIYNSDMVKSLKFIKY